LVLLSSCTEPTEPEVLDRTGVVQGSISTTASGDAWVFLYNQGEGPPGAPAEPRAVTAVSARRLQADPRYVIGQVKPNAYRLFGILDVDSDFDGTVDVLSQPTAGDRVSEPIDFQSQPGRGAAVPLEIDTPVFTEPPAFSLEGQFDDDVVLDFALDAITPLLPKTAILDFGPGALRRQATTSWSPSPRAGNSGGSPISWSESRKTSGFTSIVSLADLRPDLTYTSAVQ